MLRSSIKYGISEALRSRSGCEVLDFDILEKSEEDGSIDLAIRYRYHAGCSFQANFAPRAADGNEEYRLAIAPEGELEPGALLIEEEPASRYRISVEAVPGEVKNKESFAVDSLEDLFTAIEAWTGRLADELFAKSQGRLLVAQHKAVAQLQEHLARVPERALSRAQVVEYRSRLDQLESVLTELHVGSPDTEEEIRDEFECLRERLDVLDERSFLYAVLVRLVRYFWDEENVRLVEAGRAAARQLFEGRARVAPADAKRPAVAVAKPAAKPGAKPAADVAVAIEETEVVARVREQLKAASGK